MLAALEKIVYPLLVAVMLQLFALQLSAQISNATIVLDSPITCNGGSDGALSVQFSGGVGPFTYSWNTGQTTPSILGLSAGLYSVTVFDVSNDSATSAFTLTEPPVFSAFAFVDSNETAAGSDGGASAAPSGGTPPYTYFWSNGATTASITGLSAGNYTVTVLDVNACQAIDSVFITSPFSYGSSSPSLFHSDSASARVISLYRLDTLIRQNLKAGEITELFFGVSNAAGSTVFSDFTLKMKQTDNSLDWYNLDNGNLDTAGFQTVFSSTSLTLDSGEIRFVLDSSFSWSGDQSILIQTCYSNRVDFNNGVFLPGDSVAASGLATEGTAAQCDFLPNTDASFQHFIEFTLVPTLNVEAIPYSSNLGAFATIEDAGFFSSIPGTEIIDGTNFPNLSANPIFNGSYINYRYNAFELRNSESVLKFPDFNRGAPFIGSDLVLSFDFHIYNYAAPDYEIIVEQFTDRWVEIGRLSGLYQENFLEPFVQFIAPIDTIRNTSFRLRHVDLSLATGLSVSIANIQVQEAVQTDVQMEGLLEPLPPIDAPFDPLSFSFRNLGIIPIDSAVFRVRINDADQADYTYFSAANDSLVLNQVDTFSPGNIAIKAGDVLEVIYIGSNAGTDLNPLNDTLRREYCAPLNGLVTVGNAGDYTAISDVFAAIESCGIDSNLVIELLPNNQFNENLSLSSFPSIGGTHSITIEGNGDTLTSVFSSDIEPSSHHEFEGVSFLSFNNINFEFIQSGGGYGIGVFLKNGCNDVSFTNCNFNLQQGELRFISNYLPIDGLINAPSNNVSVSNCQFNGGSEAIYLEYGYFEPEIHGGHLISGNTFLDQANNSILIGNARAVQINNNTFSRPNTELSFFIGNYRAIDVENATELSIETNQFLTFQQSGTNGYENGNVANLKAIELFADQPDTANAQSIIANNLFVYDEAIPGNYHFIDNEIQSNQYSLSVQHNTFVSKNASFSNSFLYGITPTQNTTFQNNLAFLNRTSNGAGAFFDTDFQAIPASFNADANVFWSADTNINQITAGGGFFAWQNLSLLDANSLFANPLFLDAKNGDYTPNNPAVNNIGQFNGVSSDFFGTLRDTANGPDPGYREFDVSTNLTLLEFVSPRANYRRNTSLDFVTPEPISLRLTNNGAAIDSFTISYNFLGNTVSENVVQSLNPGDTIVVSFTTDSIFLEEIGNYELAAAVNIQGDANPSDDTTEITIRYVPNVPLSLNKRVTLDVGRADDFEIFESGFAVGGLNAVDFESSNAFGRATLNRNNEFAIDGQAAITLDRFNRDTSQLTISSLILTANLSQITLEDSVLTSFRFKSLGNKEDRDSVFVRGSDTSSWIGIYDLFANQPQGPFFFPTVAEPINLSAVLGAAGQEFTSSFQLKYTHAGNWEAFSSVGQDGMSFNDFSLFFDTAGFDLSLDTFLLNYTQIPAGQTRIPYFVTIRNTGANFMNNVRLVYEVEGALDSVNLGGIPAFSEFSGTFDLQIPANLALGQINILAYVNADETDERSANDSLTTPLIISRELFAIDDTSALIVSGVPLAPTLPNNARILGNKFILSSKDTLTGIEVAITNSQPGDSLVAKLYNFDSQPTTLIDSSAYFAVGSSSLVRLFFDCLNVLDTGEYFVAVEGAGNFSDSLQLAISSNRYFAGQSFVGNGVTWTQAPISTIRSNFAIRAILSDDYQVPAILGLSDTLSICLNDSFTLRSQTEFSSYSWSPIASTDDSINVSLPQTYVLSVSNNIGCNFQDSVVLLNDTLPVFTLGNDTSFCLEDSVTLFASIEAPSFIYQWSQGSSTTSSFTVRDTGSYSLTITDANTCTFSDTLFLDAYPNIEAQWLDSFQVFPLNRRNDTLQFDYSGVLTSSKNAVVSDSVYQPFTAGLGIDTLTFSFSDTNTCERTTTYEVRVVDSLVLFTIATQDVSCAGASDGFAFAGIVGGVAPFEYNWQGGIQNDSLIAVGGGTYDVTITDSINQVVTGQAFIFEPDTLRLNLLDSTNIACFGDSTGGIVFETSGGRPNYSLSSNNGAIVGDTSVISLPAGQTQLFVSDSLNCLDTLTVNLVQNDSIALTLSTTNATCESNEDGIAVASVAGGVQPYSYQFSSGSSLAFDSTLFTGDYGITITDSLGCTKTDSFEIQADPPPVVSFSIPDSTICENEDTLQFTSFSPAGNGGFFKGKGIIDSIQGTYLAAQAGVGADTLKYIFTNAVGCADSVTIPIQVIPSPQLIQNDSIKVCADALSIQLDPAGGISPFISPSGGTYTGSGITQGNIFNPQVVSPGVIPITYVFTDQNQCSDSLVFDAVVDTLPVVSIDPFPTICQNDSILTLTQGNPAGGFFTLGTTIPGLLQGSSTLNPSVPNIPTNGIPIDYTFVDNNGCEATNSSLLLINALPQVVFNNPGSACFDTVNTQFQLTTASPSGGVFISGVADSTGVVDLSSPAGSYSIVYQYTDADGCVNTDTNSFVINPLPSVQLNTFADTCINTLPFQLQGGTPLGGTYTGSNVIANSFYPQNAGPGSDTVFYSFTNNFGCTATAFDTVFVDTLPMVSLSLGDSICQNALADTLTAGQPSGGLYAGNGVNSTFSSFNPAGLTGPQSITYTYTDTATSCSNTATDVRYVLQVPNAVFGAIPSVCESADSFQITTAGPIGGVFSGLGVSATGMVDPSSGIGNRTITYVIENSLGCLDSASQSITINADPTVLVSGIDSVCDNVNSFVLSGGSPSGGVYFGQGVNGNFYDPSSVSPGFDTIFYAFTDQNGCSDTAFQIIEIYALPAVGFTAQFPSVCDNGAPITLTQGSPTTGGVFSGAAVSNGVFNPALVGPGNYPITYSFTDNRGCSNSASQPITVLALPQISFTNLPEFCLNSDSALINLATPAGGTYSNVSGFNQSTGFFNPQVAGVGAFPITYTFSDSSAGTVCTNSITENIFVNALPNVSIQITENDVCSGFQTSLIADGGIRYEWNTGDTADELVLNPTQSDFYVVTVTNTANCSAFDSTFLTVITGLSIEAVRDSFFTEYETPVIFDLVANDTGNVVEAVILDEPKNGELQQLFGTEFEFTPDLGYRRVDTLTYQICDQKCFDVCDTGLALINVLGDPYTFLPSGFSPNGDGINDFFIVPGIELYPDNSLVIFNRAGEPVFEAAPYSNNWDGSINAGFLTTGSKVQDGTYFYVLDMGEGNETLKGFVEVKSR